MKNKLLLGNVLGVSAFIIWGFLPLYWKLLGSINSFEIIAHRIILSFFTLVIIFLITKKTNIFAHFKNKKTLFGIIICGIMLLINWTIFIFATLSGNVLECSLAYYLNPIIVIAFGVIFLHEPLGKMKLLSMILAIVGVLVLIFGYNKVPYYALVIGFSFAIYGLLKKRMKLDPYVGLFLEIIVMMVAAIGIEIYMFSTGMTVYNGGITSISFLILLLLAGILTVLPLVLYNTAINMVSLGNMGFIQFITPTMMFFIGVFVNGEPYTIMHTISFSFIWLAVIIYCISLVISSRQNKLSQ
jgi:chloramphenicol-sensitive protein RarD